MANRTTTSQNLGDRTQVYHLPWLDSCMEETLLPGKPWHKVYKRLGAALANEFESNLRDSPHSQRSWELLGGHFIQSFLPAFVDKTKHSFPVGERAADEEEVHQLDSLCEKAVERSHCQWKCDGNHCGVCKEMMDFVNDTYSLVASEMEHILAVEEGKHQEEVELDHMEVCSARELTARRHPQSVDSRYLHLTMHRDSAYHDTDTGPVQRASPAPPPLHCIESEVLGKALSAVLTSDPSRMQEVCEKLGGRLLTASLRSSVWIDKLLRPDTFCFESTWSLERRERDRFGRTVKRRVAVMKLRSATRSPVSGLIENAVVEVYEQTLCMQAFATSEQMISDSCKALNILYVHSGLYQPGLIHWLFPLQIAFQQGAARAEHCYELSMYLHLLSERFVPSEVQVSAIAESVMNRLEEQDPALYSHLKLCTSRNGILDSQDYAVELLKQERRRALEGLGVLCMSDHPLAAPAKLLQNPAVFLHKWIGEGFLGVLELPAVLLVWDQLFMQDWSSRVMEDFCLALLMLLREAMMTAWDYLSMREVLLGHVSHLFTADIQRAWVHLQQGGLAAQVPGLNRLDARLLYGPSPPEEAAYGSAPHSEGQVLPLGLKGITLRLILDLSRKGHLHQAAWLEDFDPCAVSVTASLVYGNVNQHSKSTFLKPSVEVRSPQREMTPPEHRLYYSDVLHMDSLDLSNCRETLSKKDRPTLLFEVMYSPDRNNGLAPVKLGWARAELFVEQRTGPRTVWAPTGLTSSVPLLPGQVLGSPLGHTRSPGLTGLLQRGSEIQVTAFDLTREAQKTTKTDGSKSSEESPFLHVPWIPHNPSLTVSQHSTVQHPFDLYVDTVHYVPDNATIIKVTGQFLCSGFKDLPDIMATPDLSSWARSPKFHFRQTVNLGAQTAFDPSVILMLRVHTVCADTGELCVTGNCIIRVFDDKGRLNAGGHQLRLQGGMPEEEKTPLTEFSLHHQPVVPCSSLLIRFLPQTPDFVPAPDYLSGFYFTDDAKPNRSELGIISTFEKDRGFPRTVQEMVQKLAEREDSHVLPEQASAWLEDRLDHQPLSHLPVHRMVHYRQQAGVRVQVTQAFGLPDGLYVNTLTRVLKGSHTFPTPELPQGWGADEKFLTRSHDYSSLQRAPRWTDPSSVLHPYLEPHSVLLVQLFALDAVYRPDPSGQQCGTVSARNRGQLDLGSKSQLAWTVIPLFEGPCVNSGIHYAPLFQGSPDTALLGSVISCPVKEAMAAHLKSRKVKLLKTAGSLEVQMWDGHYLDDQRHDLPVLDSLLSINKKKRFLKTQASKSGKEMSQLVLQTLSRKIRRKGRSSAEYQREESFYEEAMGSMFCSLMETSLMNASFGPL
ncbi:hypothetical protein AGOR_G00124740 [Albula goreensis]|uniref:Uncharacterized protein n=1 Tax=Albula goreensis TaxID=1534307 RepID=A0A8T3DB78_9TELE|nr:hypothetical protein AGOR_G00124740 [Albula goreensis]